MMRTFRINTYNNKTQVVSKQNNLTEQSRNPTKNNTFGTSQQQQSMQQQPYLSQQQSYQLQSSKGMGNNNLLSQKNQQYDLKSPINNSNQKLQNKNGRIIFKSSNKYDGQNDMPQSPQAGNYYGYGNQNDYNQMGYNSKQNQYGNHQQEQSSGYNSKLPLKSNSTNNLIKPNQPIFGISQGTGQKKSPLYQQNRDQDSNSYNGIQQSSSQQFLFSNQQQNTSKTNNFKLPQLDQSNSKFNQNKQNNPLYQSQNNQLMQQQSSNSNNNNNNNLNNINSHTQNKLLEKEKNKKPKKKSNDSDSDDDDEELDEKEYQARISKPNIKFQKRLSDVGHIGQQMAQLQGLGGQQTKQQQQEPVQQQRVEEVTKSTNFNRSAQLVQSSTLRDDNFKLFHNFAFKSKAGCTPGNKPKTNQDNYIVNTSFINKYKGFFAVCDGHGVNGHIVSNFVRQNLPKNIEKFWKSDDNFSQIKNALVDGFLATNRELNNTNTDTAFSGTTTVSIVLLQNKIYSANVGDSRAILCRCKNDKWEAIALSIDQKPDDPKEMERIISRGGRVEPFKDYNGEPCGPSRVWLKNENIPGLAMSRSLGDTVAAQVGCIAEPETLEFDIGEDDKFIVLASDGVWEFLDNKAVMNYTIPYYLKNQPEGACDKLVKESVNWWKKEDEVIDDITAIVIFLRPYEKK